MATEPIFSDLDPDLKTDNEGNLLVLEDEDAINGSIENILGISRGELVMQPTIGADVDQLVGHNVDDNSASYLRMIVTDSFEQDPRVKLDKLTVEALPDEAAFFVLVQYGLNSTYLRATFERLIELG